MNVVNNLEFILQCNRNIAIYGKLFLAGILCFFRMIMQDKHVSLLNRAVRSEAVCVRTDFFLLEFFPSINDLDLVNIINELEVIIISVVVGSITDDICDGTSASDNIVNFLLDVIEIDASRIPAHTFVQISHEGWTP